jgi:hypothetical protein
MSGDSLRVTQVFVNPVGAWVYRYETPCDLNIDKEYHASVTEVQESGVDLVRFASLARYIAQHRIL